LRNKMDKEQIIQAGKIAQEVKVYAKSIIKKDMLLLEIANKIEEKIFELGGEPAFPVNLSINEIAAHYTPSHDDETKASGLLKVDLGVQINGWIADTAFSLDLEGIEENKKLIEAAEEGLKAAEKILSSKTTLSQIGEAVEIAINKKGFNPISNLSGHSMEEYDLHAGTTIPNVKNNATSEIGEGLFAIEPFATSGVGKIYDGKPSGIYQLVSAKSIRNPNSREILEYITDYYSTLPFASRWLVEEFGTKALIALKQLEQNENVHQFAQLVESTKAKVAQAENTFIIEKDKVIKTSE